ncbi:cytochrome C oxidase subunit IV family protein [Sulfuricurvum sp.]|uniref:cytochrome C oxidase subunit IV family protein n=1 Tax=Sulfuricurvum sp. TaxID=2025608 RepID=UPI00356516A8
MKMMTERVWAILILLTAFAFFVGYLNLINTFLVFVLLISTFIKGQLVIDYFMGLKEVELRYRIIPTVWLTVVLFTVAMTYYLPLQKL